MPQIETPISQLPIPAEAAHLIHSQVTVPPGIGEHPSWSVLQQVADQKAIEESARQAATPNGVVDDFRARRVAHANASLKYTIMQANPTAVSLPGPRIANL